MHAKLDKNAERYDDVSGGELRRGLDAEQMIRPQTLLCVWVLVQPPPQQCPVLALLSAYTHFPRSAQQHSLVYLYYRSIYIVSG